MENISALAWSDIEQGLNSKGFAVLENVLTKAECKLLIEGYKQSTLYRSVISMEHYRFGKGEYKYFNYPLPEIIQRLRETFYTTLAPIANEWSEILKLGIQYPETHQQFLEDCHHKDQNRPTPLILKYESGGFNTLHQDLYGDVYFPFQIVFMLTQIGIDHEGGEFVMIEQIPRAQSKAEVIRANLGDAVVFTTNFRPIKGSKGYYRAKLKHGVSLVKSGNRFALGIIFHDAA